MPQTRKRDRAPLTWFRDESFWRSVTENALGGSVVALLIFGVGWATGVLSTPAALLVLYVLACILFTFGCALILGTFVTPLVRGLWWTLAYRFGVTLALGAVVLALIQIGHLLFG